MAATAAKGDRIAIDSAKAGDPARQGTIIETIEREYGTSYRVRWDDGHESTVRPSPGTATITPGKPGTGKRRTRAAKG